MTTYLRKLAPAKEIVDRLKRSFIKYWPGHVESGREELEGIIGYTRLFVNEFKKELEACGGNVKYSSGKSQRIRRQYNSEDNVTSKKLKKKHEDLTNIIDAEHRLKHLEGIISALEQIYRDVTKKPEAIDEAVSKISIKQDVADLVGHLTEADNRKYCDMLPTLDVEEYAKNVFSTVSPEMVIRGILARKSFEDAVVQYALAGELHENGDADSAREEYKTTIRLFKQTLDYNKAFYDVYVPLADCCLKLGYRTNAINILKSFIRQAPTLAFHTVGEESVMGGTLNEMTDFCIEPTDNGLADLSRQATKLRKIGVPIQKYIRDAELDLAVIYVKPHKDSKMEDVGEARKIFMEIFVDNMPSGKEIDQYALLAYESFDRSTTDKERKELLKRFERQIGKPTFEEVESLYQKKQNKR